jgi:hypothetical protein
MIIIRDSPTKPARQRAGRTATLFQENAMNRTEAKIAVRPGRVFFGDSVEFKP